jgi:ubiquitin-conjugating enzyme E2 D/E
MQGRINKELQDLITNPIPGCFVQILADNLYLWRAVVEGPANSLYQGGKFEMSIILPQNYPFRPPEVKFLTKVYHVNVKQTDGSLCADIFQNNWAPTLNLRYVLETVLTILSEPAPEHALEPEIAAEMMNNPTLFRQKVQEYVRRYAV